MSLLISFDDCNVRGNNFLFDYLSREFPSVLLNNSNLTEQIKNNPSGKCLFTTSMSIAQESVNLISTILYINDTSDNHFNRGSNISSWRQNITAFKNLDSIFVASSALATSFLQTYRMPCKVQYPFVPKRDMSTPNFIIYNKLPIYIDKMMGFAPNESYMEYNNEEDFQLAKLYIHTPEPGEQWHINIMLAHTYGVPCIVYQQGCFSEFCTSGDKLIPFGVDERTWMSHFKLALRDRNINSKIVQNMSQRFHSMNEIQQRIKKALIRGGFHKTPPTFSEIQAGSAIGRLQNRDKSETTTFTQKTVRPVERNNEYSVVANFLNNNASVYASVGGLGDSILAISTAYTDPGSKVIFGASSGVRQAVNQMFETTGIEVLLVSNFNGSSEGRKAWDMIANHPHCKGLTHIPKDLNYGDWGVNPKKYLNAVVKKMPLVELIGKLINPRATKKVIGICPRGSDHSSRWKQRYLTREEYGKLVAKLIKENATVITFGSESDFDYYGCYQDNNAIFMNSDFAISHPAPKYPISMRHMLSAVNACDLIISMDTWLKTYATVASLPCKVVMNRYLGKSTLDYKDPSDKIFLDPSVWDFEIIDFDSLVL
jgi:hypothetical protein